MEASTLHAPVALPRPSVPASLLRLRSDEQLVAGFRGGSEDAFRAIHDRYRVRLLAYSRQMLGGSRQDAEDVLQDVFVRAYRALRTHDRPVALRAWLYRIAHNRCIDQLRRPSAELADVYDVSHAPAAEPATVVERREDLRRLVADVGRLPEQQRSALLMRELQGLTYEELASSLDVTVPAVKSLLVRARGGLVDSAEARDTACTSVRRDLALACDRGVRSSGLARRHLRDCSSCREYRDELRGVRRRLGALVPVGPLGGLVWQFGGLGGGSVAAGGSIGAGVGASSAIVTATKVALVCAAAAVTAGGALGIAPRSLLPGLAPSSTPTSHQHHPVALLPVASAVLSDVVRAGAAASAASSGLAGSTHASAATRHARRHPRAATVPLTAPAAPLGAAGSTTSATDPQTGGTGMASTIPSADTGTTGASGMAPATVVVTPAPSGSPTSSATSAPSSSGAGVTSSTGSSSSGASSSGSTGGGDESSGGQTGSGTTQMNAPNDPVSTSPTAATGGGATSAQPPVAASPPPAQAASTP